jgi:DNA-binding NtrC family response regulator
VKARVLVIDDEDAVRSSLKMIFEYEGYEVVLAASGPVGLKLAEQESPDLVLLDIKMPQMDGLEVLKKLKEQEGAPPVVILSGHGTVKTAVEAVKLGAFDFIEKPPESDRILIAARRSSPTRTAVCGSLSTSAIEWSATAPPSGRSPTPSAVPLPRTRPSSSPGRAGWARSSSPARSTATRSAATSRSSRSTARPSPRS